MKHQFCKRGHLLEGSNVYIRHTYQRCRKCTIDYQAQRRGPSKFPYRWEGQTLDKQAYRREWAVQARFLARLCEALNGCEYREFDVLLVRRKYK